MTTKTLGGSNILDFNRLWDCFRVDVGSDGWNRTTDLGVMNPTL